MITLFKNRTEAGKLLAEKLQIYNRQNAIVLALPRGGVPVGFEIAKILNIPLDVFLVRKLGFPGHEELAIGAIASGGITFLNDDILQNTPISSEYLETIKAKELTILQSREKLYRGDRIFPTLQNKIVILVDDGIATGATINSAINSIKKMSPKKIIVAVPVAPSETIASLKTQVADIVYLETPEPFYAVGIWYQDFPQTADDEVTSLLTQAKDFGLKYEN